MNLKKAIEEDKLDEFIKEHENDPPADKERFLKTLDSMERANQSQLRQTPSGEGSRSTDAHSLKEWLPIYPQLSTWLEDMGCPIELSRWAKTPREAAPVGVLRDRWIQAGRPQIDWPGPCWVWEEVVEAVSSACELDGPNDLKSSKKLTRSEPQETDSPASETSPEERGDC